MYQVTEGYHLCLTPPQSEMLSFKLYQESEITPRVCQTTDCWVPTHRGADSAGVECRLRICISNKLSCDVNPVDAREDYLGSFLKCWYLGPTPGFLSSWSGYSLDTRIVKVPR